MEHSFGSKSLGIFPLLGDLYTRKEVEKKQEAHHKLGLGETPRHLIRKLSRYSLLEKFEDAFNTALDLMQTRPLDTAFWAVFLTSINDDWKQLVASYPVLL